MTISRADIEAKARQITSVVADTKESVENTAVLAGVAVVVVIGIAYFLGRRRARAGRAVVEVYRV